MVRNLTQGSVFRNVAAFSLPFLAANFLQTLYGMADLFIVGQFDGADSITAVAVGSQVMHFLTVVIVGLSMGSTVLVGRSVGAGHRRIVSRLAGNTVTLFAALAVVVTAVLLFLCKDIALWLKTPAEAFDDTVRYLQICFVGIPFIAAFNVIASIFRGMGDSKRPMYFVACACVLNIALDFILIGGFDLGASGAACATVFSQFASVLIAVVFSRKKNWGVPISLRDLKPNKSLVRGMLNVGFPIAVQEGFIQVSFLFITFVANSRGLETAAAVGIVEKIIGFLFLVPSAMLSSVSAIASQNLGAGNLWRARATLWAGMSIAAGFGIFFAGFFQFTAAPTIALFTSDPQVIGLGAEYFKAYVFDCLIAGVHFCFSGYFCAQGISYLSFVHNALSIVLFRVPGTWLAAKYFPETLYPMGLAAPAGSLFSVVFCLVVFFVMRNASGKEKRSAVS